ncbi:hypothetical protein D5086_006350 [Populus alba]|uniref:Uncharacterized protein n=1 Tax=Populus alba TaxID=43335 RepID=A0ACC4CLD4_POPAL
MRRPMSSKQDYDFYPNFRRRRKKRHLRNSEPKHSRKGSLGGSGLKKMYSAFSTVDEEDGITIPHDFILFAEFLGTLMSFCKITGILAIVM